MAGASSHNLIQAFLAISVQEKCQAGTDFDFLLSPGLYDRFTVIRPYKPGIDLTNRKRKQALNLQIIVMPELRKLYKANDITNRELH